MAVLRGKAAGVVTNPDSDNEVLVTGRGNLSHRLVAGDVISMRSGGGGWGDPATRQPEQVAKDVRNDLISVDQARDIYRVAFPVA